MVGIPERVAEPPVSFMGGCFRQFLQRTPQGQMRPRGDGGRTGSGLGGGFYEEVLRSADREGKVC